MFALAADVSLRILAAAAAIGLVLVVLRVRSGAARHAAWSAVLVAMLTMPGLMAIVPTVAVPVPSTLALDFGGIAREPIVHQAPGGGPRGWAWPGAGSPGSRLSTSRVTRRCVRTSPGRSAP